MQIKDWDPSFLKDGIPNGAYRNVPNEVYHEIKTHLSQSKLKLLQKSPAHFKYDLDNPKEPTDDLIFGNFLHTMVLETNLLRKLYIKSKKFNRRSKAGKEEEKAFLEKHKGKIVIDEEKWAIAKDMTRSVWKNELFQALTTEGEAEITFFGEINGVSCKCRMDWVSPRRLWFFDLKTTRDAELNDFTKSIFNYGYDIQADFYWHVVYSAVGVNMRGFLFLAVEKTPPYCVNGIQLHDDFYTDCARPKYFHLLEVYKKCLKTGEYPGYSTKIKTAKPYTYMFYKEDEDE